MTRKTTHRAYLQKVDGKPPRQEQPQHVEAFWEQAPAGRYVQETKRMGNPKTPKQVRTIFGLMIDSTIAQANDLGIGASDFLQYLVSTDIPKGVGLTQDFLHSLMYTVCPTTDEEGRRVTLSKMSTVQAANLFERFRTLVGPLGIDIPDPDPNWKKEKP